jgi:8-oxo-dGTP diphosphatase
MSDYKHWVVGFVFKNRTEVALVTKNRPEWQKGRLNGVGGKIEEGETSVEAMQREFKEEAGADVQVWREFALLKEKPGDVKFLVAHGDYAIESLTDEPVNWYKLSDLPTLPTMPDLHWLIPLALDDNNRYVHIDYDQPM